MIYDNKHKQLLEDNWKWDGEAYIRDFSNTSGFMGEAIRLDPHNTKDVETSRRHPWDLGIHVLDTRIGQYYWVRICSYNNFYTAAQAVLGNH